MYDLQTSMVKTTVDISIHGIREKGDAIEAMDPAKNVGRRGRARPFKKIFDAVDKLEEMEITVNEDLLTILLLYSLPASFKNFRCAIESQDELPTPEVLKVKVLEESDARNSKVRESTPNALYANNKWKGNFQKKQFGSKTHHTVNRDNEKSPSESCKLRCYRCKTLGHKANKCNSQRRYNQENAGKVDKLCCFVTQEFAVGKIYVQHEIEKSSKGATIESAVGKKREKCYNIMSESTEDNDKQCYLVTVEDRSVDQTSLKAHACYE